MAARFPAMLEDENLSKLLPLAFLVTNTGEDPILGAALDWVILSKGNSYAFEQMHFWRVFPGNYRIDWAARLIPPFLSAHRAMFPSGQTRLVTPYFNWNATALSLYQTTGNPFWNSLVRRCKPLRRFATDAPDLRADLRITGVAYTDMSSAGDRGAFVSGFICASRNAEHDLALTVLQTVARGANEAALRQLLAAEAKSPSLKYSLDEPFDTAYHEAWRRQAGVFLRRQQSVPYPLFLRTLEYTATIPKLARSEKDAGVRL